MLQTSRTCHITKQLLAALFLVTLAAGLRAQTADFLFMEMAMDTDIETYKSQMAARGFAYHDSTSGQEKSPNDYFFEGRSASGHHVTVDVQTTPKSKTVYGLTIRFSDYSLHWWQEGGITDEEQRAAYESIKEELIAYYGKQNRHYDFLSSTDDSTRKAHAHDTFPILYGWENSRGAVVFTLANLTKEKRDIILFYVDNAASAKGDKEKIADL